MTESWRYVCPEGHVTVKQWAGTKPAREAQTTYYCQTCSAGYNRIKDKKTDEWVTG